MRKLFHTNQVCLDPSYIGLVEEKKKMVGVSIKTRTNLKLIMLMVLAAAECETRNKEEQKKIIKFNQMILSVRCAMQEM